MIKHQDRHQPWGKANQSLQIFAFSLCTGWGWLDTVTAWIKKVVEATKTTEAKHHWETFMYCISFFLIWIFGAMWYHQFLREKRRWRKERDRMLKETKVSDEPMPQDESI